MALTLDGVCLDEAAIVPAFSLSYPYHDTAGNYVSLVSATLSGQTLMYQVQQRVISNNTLNSRTGSLSLKTCNPQDIFENQGIDSGSVLEVFGWAFAAVIFFWFLGYSIGAAIEGVRRA